MLTTIVNTTCDSHVNLPHVGKEQNSGSTRNVVAMLASTPVTAATSASSYQSLFFSVFQDAGTRRWTCPSDCVRSCFRCYPRPCDRNRRDRRTAWRKRLRQFRRHGRRRWTCERRKCSLQLKKTPTTAANLEQWFLFPPMRCNSELFCLERVASGFHNQNIEFCDAYMKFFKPLKRN